MTDMQSIVRVLGDRFKLGRGYVKNPYLEAKRLRAISFLRNESNRGWVCDQVRKMTVPGWECAPTKGES